MEWFWLFVVTGIAIVAFRRGGAAQRRLTDHSTANNMILDALRARVERLERELKKLEARPPAPQIQAPAPTPPPIEVVDQTGAGTGTGTGSGTGPESEAAASGTTTTASASDPVPVPVPDPVPVPVPVPDPEPVSGAAGPPSDAAAPPPSNTLEEKIALVWFTRIGAAALLLGIAYFFKEAVDNNWIGPTGRVAIGVLFGAALLVATERIRATARAIYVNVLVGVALGSLLFSMYASYAFYHLLPLGMAFGAIVVIVLLGGALALRYRAQAILIMSLAAGFATPVLLSTGKDNPLGLFTYLLVLTSLNYAVALRCEFPAAMWLGMVGTSALYLGWYDKFYDTHAPPESPTEDVPISELTGHYYPMGARVVPLAAVTAFFAEWLAVYYFARKRELTKMSPVALLVFTSLVGHVGYASLLYDYRTALGIVLIALGGTFAFLLGREKKSELLVIPLFASFATLLALIHSREQEKPLGMLILLGAWASIYAVAFARDKLKAGEPPPRRTLVLVGIVGAGFAFGSYVLLYRHHGLQLLVVMMVLSLLSSVFGVYVKHHTMSLLALVGTFFVFAIQSDDLGREPDPRFLAEAGGWATVYLLAIVYDLFGRKLPATVVRTAILVAASLGFVALVFTQSREEHMFLRAFSTLGVGVVDLLIGAALLRRDAAERRFATTLLGLALSLFAATAAILLSGASVTLVWALLGGTVVVLAQREKDRTWLTGGTILLALAAGRAISLDVPAVDRLVDEFLYSNGTEGSLTIHAFFNRRGVALFGVGARVPHRCRARSPRQRRRWSGLVAQPRHRPLHRRPRPRLTGMVKEVHQLFTSLPPPPTVKLSDDEFTQFRDVVLTALAGKHKRDLMLTTLIFGLYAAVLVGIGFGMRHAPSRFFGLGLFALAIAKLGLYDVWKLPQVFRMLALLGVGALLLGGSFLYARYGKRIVEILKQGGGPTALVLALLLAGSARAEVPKADFKYARAVTGVNSPGLYTVEIDPALYQKTGNASCTLCDLRIVGPSGEVALLTRSVPSKLPQPRELRAMLLSPVTLPNGATQATFDLGEKTRHNELTLELDGANFLRRTKVEVSSDDKSFALLAERGVVYRVTDDSTHSSQTRIVYPVTDQRYLRITIEGKPNEPAVPIRGGYLRFAAPDAEPPRRTRSFALTPVKPDDKTPPKTSIYALDLGEPGVPFTDLTLDIGSTNFERRATLRATNHQAFWAPLGYGELWATDAGAPHNFTIEFSSHQKRYLRVEIYNGDSPALDVRDQAALTYRAEEIVFQAAAAGPHTLYVGAALGRGEYDLPSVLARTANPEWHTATFGPLGDNPDYGKRAPAADTRPFTEKNSTALIIGISVLVLALGAWTVSLLRKPPPSSQGPA